jgi:HAD superfamily hydrolase (TIGR01458 family)
MLFRMTIRAIFFDIDGTLILCGKAIAGAARAVAHVRSLGMAVRFLTNTTGRTEAAIATELSRLGIPADPTEVQTATSACVAMLKSRPGVRCHLMVPPAVLPMFDGIERDDVQPDVVVISDIGEGFDFASLNRAFLMLRAGAELVALQKNLYWFDADGVRLDCGAFVLGLEAASNKTATVTGKPSRLFFDIALAAVGCRPEEALVIGDDLSTDVGGGHEAGMRTALVATGKYADGQVSHATYKEESLLPSVADLPQLLAKLMA